MNNNILCVVHRVRGEITWVAREQVYELGVPDNVRKDISARASLNFCKSCMNAADECCGWLPAFACAHEPFPFFVWLY